MGHLSLADLSDLYTFFASSTTPVNMSIINSFAVNLISRMLAVDKCKSMPYFSNRGLSDELRITHLHAGKYWYTNILFGARYDPVFSDTMEFSRAFRSDANDQTTSDMTLFANDGKPFDRRSMRMIVSDPKNTGPTKLTSGYIDFCSSSTPTEFLRFTVNALEANLKEKFNDNAHSPIYVRRTIAHIVPVEKLQWVGRVEETRSLKVTDLPQEWYEFWSVSGIRGVSTFSKELVTYTHYPSGEVVSEWQWKMESFKTEWKIPIPMSELLASTWLH
jgi:hypothetical protein